MERKKITVIGLGFVGLPLSLSFAMRGYDVIGLDVNQSLIEDLNNGVTYHLEQYNGKPIQDILKDALTVGTFKATTDYNDAFAESYAYIVTVGLPVKEGMPVYDYFESAMMDLGKGLKQGDVVIIRSTVVPGTTEEIAKPILEKQSGLIAGNDFYLAYASERIAEGKAFEEFENMPTVVAGITPESAEKAKEVLRLISKAEIHIASDMKIVEAAKVFENVSRDVNIAMANQFAQFCQALGIDTMETFRMANTHKRVNLLIPGPGVGGYCLPNAYYYLRPKKEELNIDLSLLQMARMINDQVPHRIVNMLEYMLEKQGKTLQGAEVSVLGLAMKDYSNDDRISPAHDVCKILVDRGANVKAFDPATHSHVSYAVDSLEQSVDHADALIVLAKQMEFDNLDLNWIKEKMEQQPILIDTKHLFDKATVKELGFDYFAI
ncbi:nucleotide sugar dehydrogenase [Tepidibacillus sp. HK-1]|uniref:nucleotide sugar dehydrogenase n=1 Tax=Tepidibacillus sp. HK-1 TaxID=1883407 RepID=UPI000853CCEF|nr:nucleotide sugar dehydrogenase [Tepidibacillus sp. HK-1]GBF12290.1 UDP-N-acetyl-D-glucosamine 6-dehydrogenase [Tepidibacillus sp. HK-1]